MNLYGFYHLIRSFRGPDAQFRFDVGPVWSNAVSISK